MTLAAIIQHHPSRAHLLPDLLQRLAPLPVDVVTDPDPDGEPSSWRTYRACLEAFPEDATHALIVQDDVTPCRHLADALPGVIARAQALAACDPLIALAGWSELNDRQRFDADRWWRLERTLSRLWGHRQTGCMRISDLDGRMGVPTVATVWPRVARDALLAVAPSEGQHDDRVIKDHHHVLPPFVDLIPALVSHHDRAGSVMGHPSGWRTTWGYIGDERSALDVVYGAQVTA